MNAIHTVSNVDELASLANDLEQRHQYMLDFDHTLLLSNSTEDFISCAQPSSFIALVLKTLGFVKPWRLAGNDGERNYRDTIRVMLTLLLAPWTLYLYSKKAKSLFSERINTKLDAILAKVDPADIVIVSFGFDFIVRAMLRGSKYENAKLVAPSLWNMPFYRRAGKLQLLKDNGVEICDETSVVVTDNAEHDKDILEAAGFPYHIVWPEQITEAAFENAYIPFYYTAVIKRDPGFFIKQVLLEEMAVFVLAFGVLAQVFSLTMTIALVFFFLAYMAAYEIGYLENDLVGLQKEAAPKLSDNFLKNQNYPVEPHAWYWAAAFTILGVAFLDSETLAQAASVLGVTASGGVQQALALTAAWAFVIVAGRALFWAFNYLPVHWRVYAYLPLHISKYFGPALFILVHPVAYALLSAQLVRTWALYAVRRAGGDIEFLSSQLVRLIFFVMFVAVIALAQNSAEIWLSWETWLLTGFCVLRAAPEVRRKLIK